MALHIVTVTYVRGARRTETRVEVRNNMQTPTNDQLLTLYFSFVDHFGCREIVADEEEEEGY